MSVAAQTGENLMPVYEVLTYKLNTSLTFKDISSVPSDPSCSK